MSIFGTDGVRDLAGRGWLAPDGVVRLGRAFGRLAVRRAGAGRPGVALARDPRPSGPGIVDGLARGIAAEGAAPLDLGVLPTPALAWAVASRGLVLGIAVSASHNPPEWNGVKPFATGGRKLSDAEEREVEELLRDAPAHAASAAPVATDAAEDYIAATIAFLAPDGDLSGLRLVVDLAAGAASAVAPRVLEGLGAEVEPLHPAGSRPINDRCGTEHPRAWLLAVRAAGADGGIAFDGDGDRVLLADRWGRVLDGDHLLAALARDLRDRGRLEGGTVVGTLMTNLGLEEHLARSGIRLERAAVGDRAVAERMRALGSVLGGEPSGHLILPRDGTLLGDGLVAGVRALQAARRRKTSLSTLRRDLRVYPQILKGVRVREKRPIPELPGLAAAIAEEEAVLGRGGRLVVRYSGTEPLLRIMAEGRVRSEVKRIVARLEAEARRALAPAP